MKSLSALILVILGATLIISGLKGIDESRPEFLEEYRESSTWEEEASLPEAEIRKRLAVARKQHNWR